jgi:SAM-dependent methyltransferase
MTVRVNYDALAADYASRYARNDYSGVSDALREFLTTEAAAAPSTLEVGCGTGHWLHFLGECGVVAVGVDPSAKMLAIARTAAAASPLVRAVAEAIPFQAESFDRLFCVNALHHVIDKVAFTREAKRILRRGGALLTIGLDPHTEPDRWWIYDYFPEALRADRERYLSTRAIREMLTAAGFASCETRAVQRLPRTLTFDEAERGGFLARTSTSQLMVISEESYQAGLARIRDHAAHDPGFRLQSDLTLYATVATLTNAEG